MPRRQRPERSATELLAEVVLIAIVAVIVVVLLNAVF